MFEKYKLSNGARVMLVPQKNTKAITLLVLFGVGSRYENRKIAGLAHFLEHMMFKGTVRRPNALALSKEFDAAGAIYNAYTTKDQTGYWIKINAEHLNLACDLLTDVLHNSKFQAEEIEREKSTVIEEINMHEDDPKDVSNILLEEILFKNNSLGRHIAGSKKIVKDFSREKLVSFWRAHYFPQNMVLVVAGNFKTARARKLIQKHFVEKSTLVNRTKKKFKKFNFVQRGRQPTVKLKYKKTEQAHLSLGFPAPRYGQKDFWATRLLSIILGEGMSSRLFINIREKYGLCYYIYSALDGYQDVGALGVFAGLDKKRIYQALNLIMAELRKIKDKGISREELKRAQEGLKGRLILRLEDSAALASWYGEGELLFSRPETPEERIRAIMKVKKSEVEAVAKKVFQPGKLNLALVSPCRETQSIKKIINL